MICSQPSCRWASHLHFRNSGCRRLLSTGKHCGAPLVNANTVSSIPLSQLSIPCASTLPIIDEPSSTLSDPLQIGLNSVACGSFQGPAAMESEVLTFMMDHVMVCPVNHIRTIQYILMSFSYSMKMYCLFN